MSNPTPTPAAWRLGLVGRKVGMTRIFTEDGESIPVTVLDVSNNRVAQVKTPEVDGYAAVQVAYRSEEHTSELQSLMRISYAVFCLKKKTLKHKRMKKKIEIIHHTYPTKRCRQTL